VFSGAFTPFDGSIDGLNQIVTMNFGTATVNMAPGIPEPEPGSGALPEPGSGALLGFGLLGLLLARRRGRRS